MSYQDSNQQSFGPPPQQPEQSGWGQQSPQGSWGQPGAGAPPQNSGQSWGAPQGQIPQQPNYGGAPGYGQPQDFAQQQQQQFNQQSNQQGYGQGYPPGAQQGYLPQTDFGSGGYGPGYPMQNQGNSTLATVALWLGIFFGWGLINLVISILAIRETGPGKKLGRNKAITGLILTLAWSVVWIGVSVAISSHAKNVAATTPSSSVTTAAAGATGAAGVQATGASNDAGCQAAQTAFNTYSATGTSGGLSAIQTLGNALESAASASQVASSQLTTVGQDYVDLSSGNEPASMVSDLEKLDSACGMTFAAG